MKAKKSKGEEIKVRVTEETKSKVQQLAGDEGESVVVRAAIAAYIAKAESEGFVFKTPAQTQSPVEELFRSELQASRAGRSAADDANPRGGKTQRATKLVKG